MVLLGAAIEARADRKYVRGGITETRIPSNDALGRFLGNVTGVLNGASTVFITSVNPVRSSDVFVTKSGDILIAIGAPTGRFRLPIAIRRQVDTRDRRHPFSSEPGSAAFAALPMSDAQL